MTFWGSFLFFHLFEARTAISVVLIVQLPLQARAGIHQLLITFQRWQEGLLLLTLHTVSSRQAGAGAGSQAAGAASGWISRSGKSSKKGKELKEK